MMERIFHQIFLKNLFEANAINESKWFGDNVEEQHDRII